MATPDFKWYRDWVMHSLKEVSRWVTDKELEATFADINREILYELGLRENVKVAEVDYTEADQYVDLPAEVLVLERLSIQEEGEERFIDTIDYRNIGLRKHYADKGLGYSYFNGRTLKLSWEVTTDTVIKLYYIPFLTDSTLAVDSGTVELGSAENIVPVSLSRAFRYGVLADLMNVHGKTELHEVKARRWDAIYRSLVSRARENIREVTPSHQTRQVRDF